MHYLVNTLVFASVFVVILGIAMIARTLLKNRKKQTAAPDDYFGPEYERDLLRYSVFSESEDWRSDYRSRFAPLRLRDPELNKRRTEVRSGSRRNR